MMSGMGWSVMWFSWIFWLIIIGFIIWGVVSIVNNNRERDQRHYMPPGESALDILKKRYARGEINKEQFEQMKRDINS